MNATRVCPSCSTEHHGAAARCNSCRVARYVELHPEQRICQVDGCDKKLAATSTRKVCEMHYRRMRVHGSYEPPAREFMKDRDCSVPDCTRKAKQHDLCAMHAERYRNHGHPEVVLLTMGDPDARFWEKVHKTETCWLWTGWINENGYGQFSVRSGERMAAHRWSHVRFIGPIPEGYEVDHVHDRGCRHRHCVNPAHLEAVTPAENKRRIPVDHRANQWAGRKVI